MRFASAALSTTLLGLAFAAGVHADTRNSEDKATMEQKASPAAPKSDEERAEASQGQPKITDNIGGATVRDMPKHDGKRRPARASSSTGSSTAASPAEKEQAFKRIDMDGDGSISKAEAAGDGKLMDEFDGADKNRDGKLSRAEYDSIGRKPEAKAKAKTPHKTKDQAK